MKFWDKLTKKNHENTEVETEHVSEQNSSASSDQTPPTSDDFQNQGFGEFENLKNQNIYCWLGIKLFALCKRLPLSKSAPLACCAFIILSVSSKNK